MLCSVQEMAVLRTIHLYQYPFLFDTWDPSFLVIKLLTTSRRYHELEKDLDINAGRYLDGVSLTQLRDETYEYVVQVAEGKRTFGERACHSQVMV